MEYNSPIIMQFSGALNMDVISLPLPLVPRAARCRTRRTLRRSSETRRSTLSSTTDPDHPTASGGPPPDRGLQVISEQEATGEEITPAVVTRRQPAAKKHNVPESLSAQTQTPPVLGLVVGDDKREVPVLSYSKSGPNKGALPENKPSRTHKKKAITNTITNGIQGRCTRARCCQSRPNTRQHPPCRCSLLVLKKKKNRRPRQRHASQWSVNICDVKREFPTFANMGPPSGLESSSTSERTPPPDDEVKERPVKLERETNVKKQCLVVGCKCGRGGEGQCTADDTGRGQPAPPCDPGGTPPPQQHHDDLVLVSETQLVTSSSPSGFTSIISVHPKPMLVAASGRPVRRSVHPACCGLCGVCRYEKKLGKGKSPKQPKRNSKITHSESNNGHKTFNTKVILCDVARRFDVQRDCRYKLPVVLKRKPVRCFQQDLKPGVLLKPSRSGTCGNKSSTSVKCRKRSSTPCKLTDPQIKRPRHCTAVDPTRHSLETGMGELELPTYKSSSLTDEETDSASEHRSESTAPSDLSDLCKSSLISSQDRQENREDVRKESVLPHISKCLNPLPNSDDLTLASGKECSLPNIDDAPETACAFIAEKRQAESDLIVAESQSVKLLDGDTNGILPSRPDLEISLSDEQVMVDTVGREEIESVMSVDSPSCMDSGIGCSDTSDTPVENYKEQVDSSCLNFDLKESDVSQGSYTSANCRKIPSNPHKRTDPQMEHSTRHCTAVGPTCHSLETGDGELELPASCSASLSLGEMETKLQCETGIVDRHIDDDPETGCALIAEKSQAESDPIVAEQVVGREEMESVMSVDSQPCLDAGIGCSDISDTPVEIYREQVEAGSLMAEERRAERSYKSSHISFSEETESASEHPSESTAPSNSDLSDSFKSSLISSQDRQENREDVRKESVLPNISKCLNPLPNSDDLTLASGKECSLPNSDYAPETACAFIAEKRQAESELMAEIQSVKKITVFDGDTNGILSSRPDLERGFSDEQVMVDTVGREEMESVMSVDSQPCMDAGIGCSDTSDMPVEIYREQVEAGCSLIAEKRQAKRSCKSPHISFSVEETDSASEHPSESTAPSNSDLSDLCKSSLISSQDRQENREDVCKENDFPNISKCLNPLPSSDDLTLASVKECSLPNSDDAPETGCAFIAEKRQAESDLIVAERQSVKKIKLLDGDTNGILPSRPDLKRRFSNEQVMVDTVGREEIESVMSVDSPSCLDSVIGCSDTSDTPVEKCREQVDSSCLNYDLKESDVSQESSQLFSQNSGEPHLLNDDDNMEQPELFSCQRARVYFRRERFSCARTYIHWPFPESRDAAPKIPTAIETLPAGMSSPPAREDILMTSQQLQGEDGKRHEEVTNAREDGGEHTAVEKDVNSDTNQFQHSLGTLEPLADAPSGMTILSSPSHVYTHSPIPHALLANSTDMVTANTPIVYSSDVAFHDEEIVTTSSTSGKECSLLNDTTEQLSMRRLACSAADDDEDSSTVDNSRQENEKLGCSDGGPTQSSDDMLTSPSKMAVLGEDEPEAETAEGSNTRRLDEFTAYENDILLVDVVQDDHDLFGNLPQKSLLKLGPTRNRVLGKCSSGTTMQSLVKVEMSSIRFDPRLRGPSGSPDEDDCKRCWKTPNSSTRSLTQDRSWFSKEERNHSTDIQDDNNNYLENDDPESYPPASVSRREVEPVGSCQGLTDLRLQLQKHAYCWYYFSEKGCIKNFCRFPHAPASGDEKFCFEAISKFMNQIQDPKCLQKAGAVFTSYYSRNPVGEHFSMPVLRKLLWVLLKAGLVSDVISVISSLTPDVMPDRGFLQALLTFVTEKGLNAFVHQVTQLISKMVNAGPVQNLDCIELAGILSTPGAQPLTHAIMEVERCAKQEDWKQLGVSFKSLCQSTQATSELERISGEISRALLSETKDKLALPFVTFAETACHDESDDDGNVIKVLVGRIGVSLLFRYHKTGQWAQGKRVVEVLSKLKVKYSMLKGLFGNEDGASRCDLVTIAAELFLKCESVTGAISVLQDNEWFLTSSSWPCEPCDLDKRSHVLVHLAMSSSYRDALDVFSNLPGLKEPIDGIDPSQYGVLLNSHLKLCMNKEALIVAADTALFMFSKNLVIDTDQLQTLLTKLGKQSRWDKARKVFKPSLSVGHYADVSAPPGLLQLTVPCSLEEVELALVFEMFITVNATAVLNLEADPTPVLRITLKRTDQTEEEEYVKAMNRILTTAGIPLPKLKITHRTVLTGSREQVFILDTLKARCWLRQNVWAKDFWTHS